MKSLGINAVLALAMLAFSCRQPPSTSDELVGTCDHPNYLRPTPGKAPSRLGVSGPCIVDAEGQAVVLRGFSIADPETLEVKRGAGTALKVLRRAVQEFGASVVRIPIHKGDGQGIGLSEGPSRYVEDFVDPLVDEAARLGIYVIIDLHIVGDYLPERDYAAASWSLLAARYGSHPHVLFEMFNEPVEPDSWDTWRASIAQPTLAIIRHAAPDTLVIVGGPYWSLHMKEAASHPLKDERIAYTAHIYPEMTEKVWREQFEPVLAKHPVFVTEWGWDKSSVFPLRGDLDGFGVPFAAWMATHNLSWTAWIFDNKWSSTMFDEEWNLLGGKDHMGEFVRDLLAEGQAPGAAYR